MNRAEERIHCLESLNAELRKQLREKDANLCDMTMLVDVMVGVLEKANRVIDANTFYRWDNQRKCMVKQHQQLIAEIEALVAKAREMVRP